MFGSLLLPLTMGAANHYLETAKLTHTLILMITIFVDCCNPISQEIYDSIISSIQIHQLVCPCCHKAARMAFFGSYTRSVKQDGVLMELRVSRVICNECGSTHALLLSGIVPYSRTLLQDQADIICGKSQTVMEHNPLIDESCVRSILRMFRKHWKQAVLSASIPLHPLQHLVAGSFSFFSRQFMQIKRTPNILFLKST